MQVHPGAAVESSAANDDMFAFDPATDIWKKSDNSGHAHTYGASVLDSDTGNIYTFGGLKDMSSQGKHATDETHKATMSEAK